MGTVVTQSAARRILGISAAICIVIGLLMIAILIRGWTVLCRLMADRQIGIEGIGMRREPPGQVRVLKQHEDVD